MTNPVPFPSQRVAFDRKVVGAWSLYDFANSAFTTLVVTFIYATYFTKGIAENETVGTSQWSLAVSGTGLLVALLSPFVGALADRGGYRRRFLLVATLVCIGATTLLYAPQAGEVVFALVVFLVANVAFEMANVFYNAYLPDIAPPDKIGRVSGYGWALGYAGGLLCLAVALFAFVQPEVAPFGLDKTTGAHVRATNLLVAAWYALFSLPLFLFVPDLGRRRVPPAGTVFRSAARQLVGTFHEIRRYRQVFRLLVARLVYNDGLVTLFAFGGIYAQGTFGFSTEDIIIFGIVLNVSAGFGAWLFGYVDDRAGGKKTILITLVGLTIAASTAVLTRDPAVFWVSGAVVGLLVGPNQSASRSLMGRFVPPRKENEFFGFYAFSGKATAFMGPLLLGWFTTLFESQRAGVATIILFFVVGGLLLSRVDEAEGRALAALDAAGPKADE